MTAHVLDDRAWAALTGPHAHFAELKGQVARYPVDVAPFAAFRADATSEAWDDLAALAGAGVVVAVVGNRLPPPSGWEVVAQVAGVQLVATSLATESDPESVVLGPA